MNRIAHTLTIATATAALTAAAGAEPTTSPDAIGDGFHGVIPPLVLPDGRINHQLDPDNPFVLLPSEAQPDDAVPVIVAGDPGGLPPDSAGNRIVPNNLSSAYAGTAHIFIGNAFVCTATPIADRFLVSANHCVDANDNGMNDFGTNIRVTFSADGDSSTVIFPSGVAAVYTHPDYTGFNNPNVNDDIFIIELVNDLPAEIPRYPVYRGSINSGQQIHLVGYGTTGDAINGYINGSASFTVKRAGRNNPDRGFFGDDEGSGLAEIFQYDIDNWQTGGLGNDVETTVGGGDSGGPAYIQVGDALQLWGVNTFTSGNAPFFGSRGGGVLITGYLDFIDGIVAPVPGVFSLTAPNCDADGVVPNPLLDWSNAPLVESYTVQIATDPGMTNVIHSASDLSFSDYAVPNGLLDPCTQYYWNVIAHNENGDTNASNGVCTFTTTIQGDINGDGNVDTSDLGGLIGAFGSAGPFGDLNGDGAVDTADLGTVISAFGMTCD